eukprot:GHVP01003527.1.p1 GENE.GHVP01003527.1~~GHVP01003527.1.p1  ORF type:complete len:507 (+),score=67.55 GHVP01003527.1:204-1724(+)
MPVCIKSPSKRAADGCTEATFNYETVSVTDLPDGTVVATPTKKSYVVRTAPRQGKVGVMIVGLGGNNGTTVMGGILAHKMNLSWTTKTGVKKPNWFGSLALASTMRLGTDEKTKADRFVPLTEVADFSMPTDWAISGWDISSLPLGDAMRRAEVFDCDLQNQLYNEMQKIHPLPAAFDINFVALNQQSRADNLIKGSKKEQLEQIRTDIKSFKVKNECDKVIVIWSANTERYTEIIEGINDTSSNLWEAVGSGHTEIAPSTLYGIASVLEGCSFINGSPQNTMVPGLTQLAIEHNVFVGGDDFKSGQTKIKSVLTDFLVSAGIRPASIVSYNHLGNNDGLNLSAPSQFRSKEISKSNVVDDMVASNQILYPDGKGPDHVVVIKYVPNVGDSKRALDEYTSDIFMHGKNIISMHNTCEDSLLAAPLILDLIILTEFFERITFSEDNVTTKFHSVLSLLSYLLKSPLVPEGTPVVNSLFRQREAILNVIRASQGLPVDNQILLVLTTN